MTDTQSATQTQSAIVGRTLGRYQLLASVARGGMGQVWLGRLKGARGFHKLVAVKTLLATSNESGRFERMLLEEARIASLIHHANVVQTIELGEDEGTLYLVMEWVDGEPLSQVLGKVRDLGGFPLGVAANLIAQTLRGLHAAHELCDDSGQPLGVVHRDVSPHNVLVTYSGAAKLLDFGIAKATKGSTTETVTGEVKGKFAYMAPEQVLGTTMDRRTDLFAVGIMLYTMTSGRHPFKHHNDAGVLHAITSETPAPRPSSFMPDYPPELEAVVMKAIEKDIDKRFATAEEMRLALEKAVPAALPTGDRVTGKFIGELLADNAAARREAVRRTLLRVDAETPSAGTPVLLSGSQSVGSLGAVAVERRGTGSGVTGSRVSGSGVSGSIAVEHTARRLDSKIPLKRSRRRYQTALVAAVAVAGVALLVAGKALTSRSAALGARPLTTSAPVAAAPPERALPALPAADAASDGGTDPVGELASPAPSVDPTKAIRAARPAPKAKRESKPAAQKDLIAPDYAR